MRDSETMHVLLLTQYIQCSESPFVGGRVDRLSSTNFAMSLSSWVTVLLVCGELVISEPRFGVSVL